MQRSLVAVFLALAIMAGARAASAQTPPPVWEFRMSGAIYFLPDEENYLQPTVAADRDALHLESRYRYEDAGSVSVFGGWNLEFGTTVKLELTPMFGGLFGRTHGAIPALEGTITWGSLDFYSEAEYVINVDSTTSNFFYSWSELSFWPTEWLRGGAVFQRTRVYQTPRDIQRGFLVGAAGSKLEGTFYVFNPGSDDQFYVLSVGVRF